MNQLSVILTASENEYLTYPCAGLLEMCELGINGTVLQAVFRAQQDGKLSAPVQVRAPLFQYDPAGHWMNA
jgi:hypothetical protein